MAPENEDRYQATKYVCFACRSRAHQAETADEHDDETGVYFVTERSERG